MNNELLSHLLSLGAEVIVVKEKPKARIGFVKSPISENPVRTKLGFKYKSE